jgi:2'-5' RNA ligase
MTGTYVGLSVKPEFEELLRKFCKFNGIENAPKNFHTTLIYSRVPANADVKLSEYEHAVLPSEFAIFGNPELDERILVLKLQAPSVVERHMSLMGTYGFINDYPEYHPHITLSYKYYGDLETLQVPNFPIVLGDEYLEDINFDWNE